MRIQGLAKAREVTGRAKYRLFQDLGKEGLDLSILSLANALASWALELRWPFPAEMSEELKKITMITDDLLRYYAESLRQIRQPWWMERKSWKPWESLREIVGALLARLRGRDLGEGSK
jgi:hypothetical protein